MRTKHFIIPLLLSALFVSSCNHDQEAKEQENEDLQTLLSEPGMFTDGAAHKDNGTNYGTIVPTPEAMECIKAYADSMANHGIVPGDPRDTNLLVRRTLALTDFEFFRAYEMQDFLKAARKLRGEWYNRGTVKNKRLCVRVEFGIYTPGYAKRHGDSSRAGRICVFLVSRAWDETKKEFVDVDDPDDPQSFDFGGIHP